MESTTAAIEALTDVVLYITIYAAVVTTLFAMGEPQSMHERWGRTLAMWLCAVASVLLVIWLAVAIIVRVRILLGV